MLLSSEEMIQKSALESIPQKCAALSELPQHSRHSLSQQLHKNLEQNSPVLQENLDNLSENPGQLSESLKQLSAKELQDLYQAIEKSWPPKPKTPLSLDTEIQTVSKLEFKELDFGDELNEGFELLDLESEAPLNATLEAPDHTDFKPLKLFFDLISAHYYLNHVPA